MIEETDETDETDEGEGEGEGGSAPAGVSRRSVWKGRMLACGRWLAWFLSVLVMNWGARARGL